MLFEKGKSVVSGVKPLFGKEKSVVSRVKVLFEGAETVVSKEKTILECCYLFVAKFISSFVIATRKNQNSVELRSKYGCFTHFE